MRVQQLERNLWVLLSIENGIEVAEALLTDFEAAMWSWALGHTPAEA